MVIPAKLNVQNKTLKHFPAENEAKQIKSKSKHRCSSNLTPLHLISFHSSVHLIVILNAIVLVTVTVEAIVIACTQF